MKPAETVAIAKYLAGEMSPEELAHFELSMQQHTELREAVQAYTRLWTAAGAPPDQEHWDVDTAWTKLSGNRHSDTPIRKLSLRRRLWIPAAAVILLLAGISLFRATPEPTIYTYETTAGKPVKLADGSVIQLNTGSSLSVQPLTGKVRLAELTGEAFFQIAPDANRPFHIQCGETLTEVVGTSFDIRQHAGKVTIFVQSGKVIFRSLKSDTKALALQAGEFAFHQENRLEIVPNPSPNIQAWRTRQLRFSNMPLEDAIADMAAYFGRDIRIQDEAVKSCRITIPIPFREPDISSVLKAVAVAVQAELVEQNGQFVLHGGQCR